MKFSIITAVYNNADTITDALESVLSQTHDDIEYIVVDGASTDGTKEIIEGYKEHIATFISEPDKGIYDALNKGITNATGDIICFLHSDDIYANNDVIKKANELLEQSGADSIYGDLVYVQKSNVEKIVRYWKSGDFTLTKLKRGWMPPHPTFMVKRSVYEEYGGFDTSFRIAADYDTVLRFLGVQGISTSYLPQVMVKMRLGGESNKSLTNLKKKTLEDLKALRKNGIGGWNTIAIKNLSKIPQFLKR
jgi:glycosyltransferase involved in cell wall biosynthesis